MIRSLLIVEDDSDQLAVLERRFIRAGYQVVGVQHPRQALAASSLRPFQVAIINYELPEMDGIELAHHLQRRLGNLQVILQSYDALAAPDAESAGVFACLVKPVRMSLLEATVKRAFEYAEIELQVGVERQIPVTT